jgi:hypothetical protein
MSGLDLNRRKAYHVAYVVLRPARSARMGLGVWEIDTWEIHGLYENRNTGIPEFLLSLAFDFAWKNTFYLIAPPEGQFAPSMEEAWFNERIHDGLLPPHPDDDDRPVNPLTGEYMTYSDGIASAKDDPVKLQEYPDGNYYMEFSGHM